jgi:hypothetical protein
MKQGGFFSIGSEQTGVSQLSDAELIQQLADQAKELGIEIGSELQLRAAEGARQINGARSRARRSMRLVPRRPRRREAARVIQQPSGGLNDHPPRNFPRPRLEEGPMVHGRITWMAEGVSA